jgi:putative ABC transport system substrate-binding protein
MARFLQAFHDGLSRTGYSEGKNLHIEYRFSEEQIARLPALVADLVDRGVDIITAIGSPSVIAAHKATATIPIVFYIGLDPVAMGVVASLSRPGGNLTGVVNLSEEVAPKLIELLHELLPSGNSIALLINPKSPAAAMLTTRMREGGAASGRQVDVVHAASDAEFESVFASLQQRRVGGLVIGGDPYFNSRSQQLGALALKYSLPSVFQTRDFAAAGGLMSYGSRFADQYRSLGEYTGRVLKGEKPADLPVQQATNVELIINLKTAKALGLEMPQTLLARADEVIE